LILDNGRDRRGIDYVRMTAVLVEAVKQQRAEVKCERARIRRQQAEINRLKSAVQKLQRQK